MPEVLVGTESEMVEGKEEKMKSREPTADELRSVLAAASGLLEIYAAETKSEVTYRTLERIYQLMPHLRDGADPARAG